MFFQAYDFNIGRLDALSEEMAANINQTSTLATKIYYVPKQTARLVDNQPVDLSA
jgi:hypothetical protein